jgi:hypothetical protein
MAYMNQTKKAAIAAELKKVVPADWKYSLAVRNGMSIVMTIKSAPIDLLRCFAESDYYKHEEATHKDVNVYHYQRNITDQEIAEIFNKIIVALNTENWDRSDSMSDYFDVGHYVDLQIGRWDKPFICTAELEAA